MVKSGGGGGGGCAAEEPDAEERQRLRSLAFSKGLLRRGAAAAVASGLAPARAVAKLQGRDVVRRGGQRRSRFLFSFPGLLAPAAAAAAGGRVGELANLGSKNPVLYLEFPQGRMKLFGTHVYPKNRYLTLQLTKSAKGVLCEDVFESLIIFSEVWWIGTKDENPEELKLEFPKVFQNGEPAADCDFKGGAGATSEDTVNGDKPGKDNPEPPYPKFELEDDTPEDSDHKAENIKSNGGEAVSVRQSARTAGKALKHYAESSSGEDSVGGEDLFASDGEVAEAMDEKASSRNSIAFKSVNSGNNHMMMESAAVNKVSHSTENIEVEESSLPSMSSVGKLSSKKEPLVQTTLSSMFKKAADKKGSTSSPKRSPGSKGNSGKKQQLSTKGKSKQLQVEEPSKEVSRPRGKKNGTGTQKKQKLQVADDEIEDISSSSQDDSDEDWAA